MSQHSWLSSTLFLLCLSHCFFTRGAELSAEQLEVKGTMLLRLYPQPTNKIVPFHLMVDGCKSWVRTYGDNPVTEYYEWGTDGSQSYLLNKYSDDRSGVPNVHQGPGGILVTNKNPGPSRNKAYLDLSWDISPPGSGRVSPLWLTFASKCYFDTKKSGAELTGPLLFNGFTLKPLRPMHDRAKWQWASTNDHFFESFTCLRDHLEVGEQTNALYRVLQWTNLAGQAFPMQTELHVFNADLESKERYRATNGYSVIMRVDEIKPLGTNQIRFIGPKLPFATIVADRRIDRTLVGREVVLYLSKDGTIKTIEEAEQFGLESKPGRIEP